MKARATSTPQVNELRWPLIRTHIKIATQMRRIDASLKFILCLLSGLMMNTITPSAVNAANHIKVTREILLEDINPESIVRTLDGGYVVAGGQSATRIDATDKVIWRYTPHNTIAHFRSAALLPDDSVVLCGEVEEKRNGRLYTLGLLIHLDKMGQLIDEKRMSPNDGKLHGLSQLTNCIPFEGGIALFGATSDPTGDLSPLDWFLVLDAKGNIKFEKLAYDIGFKRVLKLADNSFLTHTHTLFPGFFDAYRISRVEQSGSVSSTRVISNWSFPIKSTVADLSFQLLASDLSGTQSLELLNDKLETIRQIKTSTSFILPTGAYSLPDKSIILFGNQPSGVNAYTASMQWLSPDLTQTESYVFDPHFASYTIINAIPTEAPGEFVVTRLVTPVKQIFGSDERRQGAVLTFVQIR